MSSLPYVTSRASEFVASVWVQTGQLAELLEAACNGSKSQRLGVAKLAAHWIAHDDVARKCASLLKRMFDDDDHDVRQKAGIFLRSGDLLQSGRNVELIASFVDSKALIDSLSSFVHLLKEHPGSLRPIAEPILLACEKLSQVNAEEIRPIKPDIYWQLSRLSSVLIRLYGQAERDRDQILRNRCLSSFNALLMSGAEVSFETLDALAE